MLRKIFTTALGLATIGCIQAQDSKDSSKTAAFKLSGSADVYHRYNFHNPESAPYNNLTSFTNSHRSFELGMASIKAEHSIGKVGMVADLGFGRRADEFSYNDANSRVAIKQLYLTYAPSSAVKFTAGSWGTHIGYELVDAYLNRNYSMSYMFSYGPFFHTGIKADFALGGKTGLMVGLTNPTDLKTATGMPKMVIGQFSTGSKDDKFKAYVNFQGGKYNDSARLNQGDVVLTYAFSPKFSMGYNGTVQSRSGKNAKKEWLDGNTWWGSALYLNADPTDWFGLTLRGEYLSDDKSVLGFDGNVFETTLSANFKIDNLTLIPEIRLDNGSTPQGLFVKNSGASTKSTGSLLLAAVYHF
ncbi:porin [Segetibacter sp. 3557_3]|uniref:outer membrane beta-barrel protein n=1 Tax=Segetibacter sp. 3557_3 TaxID=2547429 RepID=UPI001058987C|nr:outer membrane beta-barrel protein [Segetibacter sp. 3557_3]TDH28963.1 porin [Segetibacter sp. 3557_3]